jgi:glycosyltransferase involved in cell wall biosynthesis
MLRIAYLLESTELSGGVKVILQQAEALARRGHRVTVVSPGAPPAWFPLSRARHERSSFRESRELAEADIRVATFWTTVAPALDGARGPVFHLCQGYEGAFTFYDHQRQEIEAAYGAPTRKLAVSQTLVSKLDDLGFGPAENVGQAFDGRDFFPAPENRVASIRTPVVLLVGPYEADVKGVGIGLEGLRIWRERGGVFRLRRVSTHPLSAEEQATSLPGEYHHDLSPRRMPYAYRASDVYLGPNRPEEGFGLPLLEALACGLPCLLSDTPGHREISGKAAWYFPDGDPGGMAAALPGVVTGEARARARVEGPRVASRFDAGRVAANLESAFERALSVVGPGGSPTPPADGPAPAV